MGELVLKRNQKKIKKPCYLPAYLPTYLPTLPTCLTCKNKRMYTGILNQRIGSSRTGPMHIINTYLPTYQPTNQPTNQPTYLPTYLLTYLPTCLEANCPKQKIRNPSPKKKSCWGIGFPSAESNHMAKSVANRS